MNEELETLQKELKEKLKGIEQQSQDNAEDVTAVKLALQKSATKEDLEAIKNTIEDLAKSIEKSETFDESILSQINTQIKEKFNDIEAIRKAGSGVVTIKAVGTITTGSGTYPVAPPAVSGTQQAPLTPINLRSMDIVSLTNNVNTTLSAYPYTESVPKDGDYSFLEEGGTKPQIDFKWETRYATPFKVAAWERLTEESVQDVVNLQSIAQDYLLKKHNLKKAKGILNGDGVLPNPKGATKYGRNFVAGDMANAIDAPNFIDVVNACVTDIATTHNYTDEMPYMANLSMINPIDFFVQFQSAKTQDGVPLYPTAQTLGVVQIGGLTIVPEEAIESGKILVCDMSKYNTTNYMEYTVKIGWVNDDFIKNQFVILGESRFHAFVKKLDEQAFIYDDIEVIKTAITKPVA